VIETVHTLEAMGIRHRPSSARSPWQNGHAERLISSIRKDCLDHVVVFGERHLRHLLNSYQRYYNEVRTHLSLQKDAPIPRDVQSAGRVIPVPPLGGLLSEFEFPTGTGVRALQTWSVCRARLLRRLHLKAVNYYSSILLSLLR
jgi:Integrase core domain